VLAVALHDAGQTDEAIAALEQAHAARPADPDVLYALALFSRDAGDLAGAAKWAARLQARQPGDPQVAALVAELAAAAKDGATPTD
jgi:Tfp pilus assembly protein PilF